MSQSTAREKVYKKYGFLIEFYLNYNLKYYLSK